MKPVSVFPSQHNTDTSRVNNDAKWFVACTCARHEKKVAEHLAAQGVEYLLPLYDSLHHWKNGPKRVQLPLFPGYVFVRVAASERVRVLRVPSVAYLLGSAQGPMPLADDEIRAVRKLTDDTLWAEPCPYISLGQRVKVRSGALKDLEGVLVRKKDAFRLVVSVDTIMRSVMIEVNAANIEIIPMRVAA